MQGEMTYQYQARATPWNYGLSFYFYFYFYDETLGPIYLRIGSYVPFLASAYLNGHDYSNHLPNSKIERAYQKVNKSMDLLVDLLAA